MSTPRRTCRWQAPCLMILFTLWTGVQPVDAGLRPSSDLLLPWFEVDLDSPSGATTLVAVGSAADEVLEVRMEATSNWGIPVLRSSFSLEPGQVRTFNLRDWLVGGELPDRRLAASEREHVQTCLRGLPSTRDGLYYASATDPARPGRMVGAVTFRVVSQPRADGLWGDYFQVHPGDDLASGDRLVDIDRFAEGSEVCKVHRLRYLQGGAFDGGTRLVVWSDRRRAPSATPDPVSARALISGAAFHDEPGVRFAEREMELLPVSQLAMADLALDESSGWLDLVTEEPVFVGVRYESGGRYGVGIASWCLADDGPPIRPATPSIDLETATNGHDADAAPGPTFHLGEPVTWTYQVTNTGETHLGQVAVSDDRGVAVTCPATSLAAGESMTCTGVGVVATLRQYATVGTAVGTAPGGVQVHDTDPSHYWGETIAPTPLPSIALEAKTDGQDADVAPGPLLPAGLPVTWTYVVVNAGEVSLDQIVVTDDQGVVVLCPATSLEKGESMTCTATGVAILGQYANLATVRAESTLGDAVTASDPSHYLGQ